MILEMPKIPLFETAAAVTFRCTLDKQVKKGRIVAVSYILTKENLITLVILEEIFVLPGI